jgi:hypothetical protein
MMKVNSSYRWIRSGTWLGAVAVLTAAAIAPSSAKATPILQIYVEGATYDSGSETWVLQTEGSTARVWVIGNVDSGGGKGTISDVNLIVAYDDPATSPTVTVASSTTGGLGGYTDPSTPDSAAHVQTVDDGSAPTLGDGSSLPPHGIYGDGTEWQQFALGDFSLTDSPIGDIINTFPGTLDPDSGQINVYEVSFSGYTGTVHFDAFGATGEGTSREQHWAAPFSHDGETTFGQVPELSGGPTGAGSLALALGGALLLGAPARKRRK